MPDCAVLTSALASPQPEGAGPSPGLRAAVTWGSLPKMSRGPSACPATSTGLGLPSSPLRFISDPRPRWYPSLPPPPEWQLMLTTGVCWPLDPGPPPCASASGPPSQPWDRAGARRRGHWAVLHARCSRPWLQGGSLPDDTQLYVNKYPATVRRCGVHPQPQAVLNGSKALGRHTTLLDSVRLVWRWNKCFSHS